jgi:hypothetical protein
MQTAKSSILPFTYIILLYYISQAKVDLVRCSLAFVHSFPPSRVYISMPFSCRDLSVRSGYDLKIFYFIVKKINKSGEKMGRKMYFT